jgi:lipoteichoic acid synthase
MTDTLSQDGSTNAATDISLEQEPSAPIPRDTTDSEQELSRTSRSAATKAPVFFVVLVVLLVAKAWLMRGFALGAWNPLGAVFEVGFVVMLLGLADVAPPRRWYWLDVLVYSLLSVLLFAMTVYVHFYAQLFDPHMMAMAGQLGTVSDVVAQLIKPEYALLLIDIPVLIVWVLMLRGQAKKQQERLAKQAARGITRTPRRLIQPAKRSLRVAIVTVVALVVVAGQLYSSLQVPAYVDGVAIAKARGLAVAQATVFLPRSADDPADDDASADVVAPNAHASAPATASAVATAPLTPGGKMEARIERIRGALDGSRIATFAPGAFRGKNLIIVQVEALNTMLIQKKIGGREVTPNLNKLAAESWFFPNTYSQTGIGNTADAEFIVNSSLLAPRSQAASVLYADRVVPSLPRLLNGMSYSTFTLHPNRVAYWNRKELYAALGFSRYYDIPFFRWNDMIGMGSSDEVLFRKGMEVLQSVEASKTPFYAQFITLSAHTPFDAIPQSRRPIRTPAQYRGSLLGDYISAESYGDMAIGKFVSALKATDLWDNSIIVLYGDHTSMLDNTLSGADAKAAQELLGRAYGPADRQRIPLMIHLPKQTTPVLNLDTVGQVDIMPTVADLLGIDLTQVPHVGRSVFVQSNALVAFNSYLPGGSFVNGHVVFMPGLGFDDGEAVNIADNSSAKPGKAEQLDYKRMLELTKLSDKWARSLPKRKGAGDLGDAWIPNAEARKAAKPYGASQKGLGSE